MKRVLDIVLAAAGLVILSPLFVVCALLIKLTSTGPIFYLQERVGRQFRSFRIIKFRTMAEHDADLGRLLTVGKDPRITPVGRFLRWTKMDELPQLINVFTGDMSLVGPRPEAPCFVDLFRQDYEQLLAVRPGLTDLASIKYRDEAALLAKAEDPEQTYVTEVLPDKIALAKEYVRRSSVSLDVVLIGATLLLLLLRRRSG